MVNNKDTTSTRLQVQGIKTRARPGQEREEEKGSRHDNSFKIKVSKKINL
jgi:hypothetical protein